MADETRRHDSLGGGHLSSTSVAQDGISDRGAFFTAGQGSVAGTVAGTMPGCTMPLRSRALRNKALGSTHQPTQKWHKRFL